MITDPSGSLELAIDENTILIVLGQSKTRHKERNKYIQDKAMGVKSNLSTANSEIRSVIVETFANADELETLLPGILEIEFKQMR